MQAHALAAAPWRGTLASTGLSRGMQEQPTPGTMPTQTKSAITTPAPAAESQSQDLQVLPNNSRITLVLQGGNQGSKKANARAHPARELQIQNLSHTEGKEAGYPGGYTQPASCVILESLRRT